MTHRRGDSLVDAVRAVASSLERLVARVVAGRRVGGLRRFGLVVAEDLVEQVLVETGGVERVAAATVGEREAGGGADVRRGHLVTVVPGSVGHRRPGR